MNCPNCGAENASESKFCVGCGAPVSAEAPAQASGTEASVKTQIADTLKPVTSKINKKVIFGAVAVVAVVAIICVLFSIFGGGNGFVEMKNAISIMQTGEGEYSVVIDKKVLSDTIESETYPEMVDNINGKVAAILADKTLYVVKGNKLKEVANDVTKFELSVDGKGIAYTTKDEEDKYPTLFLYTVSNGKKAEITDKAYGNYVISPDGKSVAYFVAPDEDDKESTAELNLFKGKKSTKITDDKVSVLGLSNGGKQIYVTSRNDDNETILYSYNAKGNKQKLGEMTNSYGYMFNDDHTQIMFLGKKDKMYLSIKGKEAAVMAKDSISLVYAPNANYGFADGNTYPVSKLYNHVYKSGDEVWMIKKNSDKNVKLVSKASSVQLDASAEYIYYTYDAEELRVAKISDGEKASEKAKVLVEERVSDYVVTSDRKYVYYIEDQTLYSVNGKKGGTPKTITNDDVTGLALSGKDKAYYTMDGDLYVCSNGKKGTKVLGDVTNVMNTANGVVYSTSEDALYCTTGSKKLKKVCDLETGKKSDTSSDYSDYGDIDLDDLKDYLD